MTPLMKPRRETDCEVASDMFISSIAGSPRRVGNRPDGEGFGPAHDNPVRVSGSMIFQRGAAGGAPRCLQMAPATHRRPGSIISAMHLTFLGAAGTVTGSRHLLEVDGHRIL